MFGINQNGKISDNVQEYLDQVNTQERNLEILREKASREIKVSQQNNKRYYDKKRKPPFKYKIGDLVAIKNFDSTPGVAHKLIPRFKGPYKIIKELRNNRYVVADLEGFQLSQKPYQGVWEPANMRPWHASTQSTFS